MDVANHPVVRALRPARPPYLAQLSEHSDLQVWHIDVNFSEFVPTKELMSRWADKNTYVSETWQKRPLLDGRDSGMLYSCGEVELVARLRSIGYEAYWISEWVGFKHVPAWEPFCIKRNEIHARAPQLWEYDQMLRSRTEYELGKSGGHPDIACVTPEGNIYLEYKGPGDRIRPKQNMWAATLVDVEQQRLAYLAVRGFVALSRADLPRGTTASGADAVIPTRSDTAPSVGASPIQARPQPDNQQRQNRAPTSRTGDKLHRRTISDTLKRQKHWQVTSKVDGSIDFTPPLGVSIESFAVAVKAAIEAMGYTPTVRIGRGSGGYSVVRVHTPETLAQAPRGAHEPWD